MLTRRAAALILLAALPWAACAPEEEAAPGEAPFTPDTPRQVVLDRFPEVLAWSDVRVDQQMVLGQSRCVLTVTASDTSAADAIRTAFLPIVQAVETTTCPAVVALRLVPFTRAQVEQARARVDSLLPAREFGTRTHLQDDGRLAVEVKNFPAVARASAALEAGGGIPAGMLAAVRPRAWMREADAPKPPPLEAYTAVLARQVRHATPGTRLGVLRASLPRGFGNAQLAGMPITIVDDASAADVVVRFGKAGQLDDGVFTIEVAAGPNAASPERPVGVDCAGRDCFLVEVAPPSGATP